MLGLLGVPGSVTVLRPWLRSPLQWGVGRVSRVVTGQVAHAAWLGSWGLAWHSMAALHPRLFDGVHLVPPQASSAASVPSSLFAGIAASFEVVSAAEASILDARGIGVTLPAGAPRPSHAPPVHPQEYAARTHTHLQRAYGRYLHTEDWLRLRDSLTEPRERA